MARALLPVACMGEAHRNDRYMRDTHFATRIDVPSDVRAKLVKGLNVSLATTLDLELQVRSARWNVKGAHFSARNELFAGLAEHLESWSDALAERISALGGFAEGTLRLAAEQSPLPDHDVGAGDGRSHLSALAERYGDYCSQLRKLIDAVRRLWEPATEDLLTSVLVAAEKDLRFVEAHLQTG